MKHKRDVGNYEIRNPSRSKSSHRNERPKERIRTPKVIREMSKEEEKKVFTVPVTANKKFTLINGIQEEYEVRHWFTGKDHDDELQEKKLEMIPEKEESKDNKENVDTINEQKIDYGKVELTGKNKRIRRHIWNTQNSIDSEKITINIVADPKKKVKSAKSNSSNTKIALRKKDWIKISSDAQDLKKKSAQPQTLFRKNVEAVPLKITDVEYSSKKGGISTANTNLVSQNTNLVSQSTNNNSVGGKAFKANVQTEISANLNDIDLLASEDLGKYKNKSVVNLKKTSSVFKKPAQLKNTASFASIHSLSTNPVKSTISSNFTERKKEFEVSILPFTKIEMPFFAKTRNERKEARETFSRENRRMCQMSFADLPKAKLQSGRMPKVKQIILQPEIPNMTEEWSQIIFEPQLTKLYPVNEIDYFRNHKIKNVTSKLCKNSKIKRSHQKELLIDKNLYSFIKKS